MPKDIKIKIGVSVRPDNRGNAHTSDVNAVAACGKLFADPVVYGKGTLRVTVEVVPIPDARNPSNGRMLADDRTKFLNTSRFKTQLGGIDLLYIPGAPVAPSTQRTDEHGMKATRGFKYYESVSRDPFETALIEKAMTLGIPVLAVCAGSWRLLETFGGEVRELNEEEYALHGKRGWAGSHGLEADTTKRGLIPDAMIEAKAPSQEAKKTARNAFSDPEKGRPASYTSSGANTTHWAVANTITTDKGKQELKRHDKGMRTPADLLDVMVTEPGTQTVEAFESKFGAPIIGTQWHPESFNPGMKGLKEKYKDNDMVEFSQKIFRTMVLAAVASKYRRRSVVPSLKEALANTIMLNSVREEKST